MDFFADPFADFDAFFGAADESMSEPDPARPDRPGALAPLAAGPFFGPSTSLRRLTRGLGRSFDEAFRRIEEMSKAPEQPEGARCYCSATSEVVLPGGAREVRHTSRDSKTGKELSLHTREVEGKRVSERRERDLRTGREERRRDLLNVDEQGLGAFERDWARLCPGREAGELPRLK